MAISGKFRKRILSCPVRRCKGRPWRRAREAFFNADPLNRLCKVCLSQGLTVATYIVDHVIPVSERPDLEFDPTNFQGLCKPHSDAKTARENAGGKAAQS